MNIKKYSQSTHNHVYLNSLFRLDPCIMYHSLRNEMERARCVSLSDDKLFYSLHPDCGDY